MAEMKDDSRHLTIENCTLSLCLRENELSEVTANKTTGPKSGGDGYQTLEFSSSNFGISNIENATLCSVDKMRIDHLISELDKCTKSKKETELQLAANKSENQVIQRTFESYNSRHEAEKIDLKSRVSTDSKELQELTTNASYSLDILADHISAWEVETALIGDTVDELLGQKLHFKKEMNRMGTRMMVLKAEESRIEDTFEMKKLQSGKQTLKTELMMMLTSDIGSQTDEEIALP